MGKKQKFKSKKNKIIFNLTGERISPKIKEKE